jgi:hypothetical protein
MTGSLVFYHMTRIKHPSLPVTPWVSALVSSGLIVCGVVYCLSALVPYNLRSDYELKHDTEEINVVHEANYVIMYNVIGAIMVLLQLVICVYIIRDSWKRTK